jgi:Hydrazine synthase alpha subunit middle domain
MPPESSPPRCSLFTVYNDGTGVSPYACQHDGSGEIGRPRELPGGRIAFLSRATRSGRGGVPEMVLASRPWLSRRELLPADVIAEPLFHDPAWDELEAVRVESRKRPMGRISTIDIAKKSGVVFCLDVDHTTYEPRTRAARVRILAAGDGGTSRPLGEVPVHEDGSFMAEVPADVALGFEALDEAGNVVRRLPPSVWVRPGENRGCIGCHEPHGLAPRNRRPLAVKEPPVAVGLTGRTKPGKSS